MEKETKIQFAVKKAKAKVEQLNYDIALMVRERDVTQKIQWELESIAMDEKIGE